MSTILDAWSWLTTAQNWLGEKGIFVQGYDGAWKPAKDSILGLAYDHLLMTVGAVGLASAYCAAAGRVAGPHAARRCGDRGGVKHLTSHSHSRDPHDPRYHVRRFRQRRRSDRGLGVHHPAHPEQHLHGHARRRPRPARGGPRPRHDAVATHLPAGTSARVAADRDRPAGGDGSGDRDTATRGARRGGRTWRTSSAPGSAPSGTAKRSRGQFWWPGSAWVRTGCWAGSSAG